MPDESRRFVSAPLQRDLHHDLHHDLHRALRHELSHTLARRTRPVRQPGGD